MFGFRCACEPQFSPEVGLSVPRRVYLFRSGSFRPDAGCKRLLPSCCRGEARSQGVVGRQTRRVAPGKSCRSPWLVANRATLPQKWTPAPRNVADEPYPLCGETLEPLARFVRKLPKDSNLAEDSFPGLINQEFLGSFSTDKSICSA